MLLDHTKKMTTKLTETIITKMFIKKAVKKYNSKLSHLYFYIMV